MNLDEEELKKMLHDNPDLAVEDSIGKVGGIVTNAISYPVQHEAELQKQVIKYLQADGWLVGEFRKARRQVRGKDVYRTPFGADGVGFPDIVAVRPPRVLFIENKSSTGTASSEQIKWLLALGKCPGVETLVMTPDEFERFKEKERRCRGRLP